MVFYSRENSTRWPYTFAYDWIRMAGLAESRVDAAQWFKKAAGKTDAIPLIEQAAQEYCDYYNAINELNAGKEKSKDFWVALNSKPENNAWN